MTRLYGRIIGGDRLKEAVSGGMWNTTSIISSIRVNGSYECMTVEGATDGEIFRIYINEILCPSLVAGDFVIMDNLSSHKVSGIREAIERTGAFLFYLPPYSPDLNPIEKMWSKIKASIRKAKARSSESMAEAISDAFRSVTPKDSLGWFGSCGYVLIQS
jgi:transposase